MANISQNVNIEMLEKLPDGTYKRKHPETKASQVKLEDAEGNFVATEVEGAMNELFTNVSNGKQLVGGAITDVDDSVVIPTDPTFQDLASAISEIKTGYLSNLVAGDVVIYNDATSVISAGISYLLRKQVKTLVSGNVRVGFSIQAPYYSSHSGGAYGRIYINNVPSGIERYVKYDNYTIFAEDLYVNSGDLIQIYTRNEKSPATHSIANFSIGVDLTELKSLFE